MINSYERAFFARRPVTFSHLHTPYFLVFCTTGGTLFLERNPLFGLLLAGSSHTGVLSEFLT
jgi:hypothetical protein